MFANKEIVIYEKDTQTNLHKANKNLYCKSLFDPISTQNTKDLLSGQEEKTETVQKEMLGLPNR
jgi:hypothetical protein